MANVREPHPPDAAATDSFAQYASLVERLWPGAQAVEFLSTGRNGGEGFTWSSVTPRDPQILSFAKACQGSTESGPFTRQLADGSHVLMVPILFGGKRIALLGVHARQPPSATWRLTPQHIENMLRPICELAARDLDQRQGGSTRRVPDARAQTALSQRTEELEWLFAITAQLRSGSGERDAISGLVLAATERMESSLGAALIPGKSIELSCASERQPAPEAVRAFAMTSAHLLSLVQRRKTAVAINSSSDKVERGLRFKILAAPVIINGEVAGVLCFYRAMDMANFRRRQLHLGRHIARQIGAMLESEYDLSTGLFTRSAFVQRAGDAVAALPPGQPHSVLYADIDRLSLVNQEHGFAAGDEAIVRIADLLRAPVLPAEAISCRPVGDSFAVFLPNHDIVMARNTAEALQAAIARQFAGAEGSRGMISVSLGVTRLAVSTDATARALAVAELACRNATARGGNRIEVILDVDEKLLRHRTDVLTLGRLREAIAQDRLVLYAQRIAPTFVSDSIGGMECLVRLLTPEGEVITAGTFLPPAQRFGLMRTIDEVVIKKTLAVIARYSRVLFSRGAYVSINVSGQSLSDDSFLDNIEGWVRESGAAPGLVTFEVTETEAVANLERAAAMMRRLKRRGCRFALDDFGTGVNSLVNLKYLPIDRVKIDGSFVRDLLTSQSSMAMVTAVGQLARTMRIDCVAEFVESEAILTALRRIGIPFVQGNFVHAPQPLTEVLDAIARENATGQRLEY
ncbi:MAG: bifunctional diguanylate cyclase/phosphodiesterase [Steroidobacteraceae bacterium]